MDEDEAARQEAIDYWCSLSFVYETASGDPSDETNLLDLKAMYTAGEIAAATPVWTEDFDDWMALESVLQDVWADLGDDEEEEHEEEEEEEEEMEEEGEDMVAFWKTVQYKVQLGGAATGALGLPDLQAMIQSGQIQDETTPMQVQGPDGQWEEWSTMGEIIADYDGFEEALFMSDDVEEVGGAGGVEDDPDDGYEDATEEDDPVAYWVQQSYEYKDGSGSTKPGTFCIGELQEMLASGAITPATKVFCDEFENYESIAAARDSKPTFGLALDGSYWASLKYAAGEGEELGAEIPSKFTSNLPLLVISRSFLTDRL